MIFIACKKATPSKILFTVLQIYIPFSKTVPDDNNVFHQSPCGTKSSKSGDCTDCSADVLTRANTVTSLTYDTYGDDGVLNYQSVVDFCCDEEGQQTYLQAIEFTSGCLAYTNCLIGDVFNKVSTDPNSNATVTASEAG